MVPTEEDLAYLWDMLQAARDAVDIMAGKSREEWSRDKVIRLAVERSVEIVGETARHVSKSMQSQHPEIPWRQIVGLRNILAHEYGQIDYGILYDTVIRDIPVLVEHLSRLVPSAE